MDKSEQYEKLKLEVFNYYINKIKERNIAIEERTANLFKDIENGVSKKCNTQLERLNSVSEKHVDITPNGTETRFIPKDNVESYRQALADYEDCANSFYLNMDSVAMLKDQFKKLNQKSWEGCTFECEKKLMTGDSYTIDDARSCLLNCANLLRFNFKSYSELIAEDIDGVYTGMKNII
jgi:hypothetical protein